MANASTAFFYWYRRQKVRAQDMTNFQKAMVETARAQAEGLVGAAVLQGLEVTPGSGLQVAVSSGIAAAASGYIEVAGSQNIDVSAATGNLPCRSLIVIRPDLQDANPFASPTNPSSQVPLNQLQMSKIVLIPGTPSATPEYPSKQANDAILCGLIVPVGTTQIMSYMLDFEQREVVGVNSLIAQNQVRYDDRLRPFRLDHHTMGVKPSQNKGSKPVGFIYTGKGSPSVYPLQAGSFISQDSFVDFATGVISGGDMTTPSFTPTVPTGNQSLVCAVTLTRDDILDFRFGTQGSFQQCVNAIQQQTFSGPGCVPSPNGEFAIAFVILTARSGSLSDLQIIDARPFLGTGAGAAKYLQEVPSGVVNGGNASFTLSKTPADPESLILFLDGLPVINGAYTITGTDIEITDPDYIPQPGQSLYAYYLIFGAVSVSGGGGSSGAQWSKETPTGATDGVNATFTLLSAPVDPDSLFFWVDNQPLDLGDYSLTGQTVVITNPDVIPAPGQRVMAQYVFSGVLPGGGGGGSASFSPFGNYASGIVVNPSVGIGVSSDPRQLRFVKSQGGSQIITANPQVASGSFVGQELLLKGTSDVDYPVLNDGNGVATNGAINLKNKSSIWLVWDGQVWSENGRR